MLSLISVMSPPTALCNLSIKYGEVMYFGFVCFRGELGSLNFNDICMCVVNEQFELLEFVFDSVYVDLQYDRISLTSTAGFVSLWSVCNHVVVFGLSDRLSWYPMWMWWLIVMHVLLFVLHVCMLRV